MDDKPTKLVSGDNPASSLADKVAFLSRPSAYPFPVGSVERRETHMSWVFLAADRVYKLKKPVRFPYLDFSTLAKREAACRAELRLNRRLASDVYLDVTPLAESRGRLSFGGTHAVDWLVVMRRLDENSMLEQLIAAHRLTVTALDRLAATLTDFYRSARPVRMTFAAHLREWRTTLADNRHVLLDPRSGLPAGQIRRIDHTLRRFLSRRGGLFARRLREGRIVDGHGDLRPEHIWLGDRVKIIDCIEFNARLRAVDPFDEIAFLSLECERLGARWAGVHLQRRMARALRDGPTAELFGFYRCQRAMLRARLAVAHLFEPNPRTPEKWRPLARDYLRLANRDAVLLERALNSPGGR